MRRLPAVLALLLASGCRPASPPDGRPRIVVTLHPVASLVEAVAGPGVDVRTLLPTDASPDTWEATPGQIRTLATADAFVSVGGGLDGWLDGLAAGGADLRRLRIADGVPLRPAPAGHRHGPAAPGAGPSPGDDDGPAGTGGGDPHLWLDPLTVRDAVLPRIRDLVAEVAPAEAAAVRARSEALADSLTALDAWIRERLEDRARSGFVTAHGGWGWFADRYGLHALGHLYERPGHEPSARELARTVDAARASGLRTVLAEPQLPPAAARALAAELDGDVRLVDPLGGPDRPGRDRYLDLMRFNAAAFAAALGG